MNLISKPIPEEHRKDGNRFYVVARYPEGESPDRYEACVTREEAKAFLQGKYAGWDNMWIEEYKYELSSRLVAYQAGADFIKYFDCPDEDED